jgi:phospholipid/cholesterol/gamma-HCH transport system substrate-binding protein
MRATANLRREARWLWPIGAIMAVALVCAVYILTKQRLESPLAERYGLNIEFAAADGVKGETGSPVTVAGVAVGQIDSVRLEDGRGVIHVRIDPQELPSVHEGARAVLTPNTPLKDMQVRLDPGPADAPRLPAEATIALRDTTSPVDSDELLRGLDTDTRDWVELLINDMGVGFAGRERDLNALLRSLGPTTAQMREVTELLSRRRETIRDLVTNLRVVAEATADADDELRLAVDAGNATLEAVASQDDALQRSLELLPAGLDAVDRTLERATPFAGALRRGLTAVDEPLEKLPRTLRELPDATRGLVPLPAGELASFVDAIAPLTRHVRPAARDLGAAAAPMQEAFAVLSRTSNAMAHQPDDGRQGYLFWLAWFAHNVNSMLSTGDAHGSVVRGYVLVSCASVALVPTLTQVLTDAGLTAGSCPGSAGP